MARKNTAECYEYGKAKKRLQDGYDVAQRRTNLVRRVHRSDYEQVVISIKHSASNQNSYVIKDLQKQIELWKAETRHSSSVIKMLLHPRYLRIIALAGQIPHRGAERLLLTELDQRPDHWFAALAAIVGENPVKPEYDFDQAVAAWLEWGKMNGVI